MRLRRQFKQLRTKHADEDIFDPEPLPQHGLAPYLASRRRPSRRRGSGSAGGTGRAPTREQGEGRQGRAGASSDVPAAPAQTEAGARAPCVMSHGAAGACFFLFRTSNKQGSDTGFSLGLPAAIRKRAACSASRLCGSRLEAALALCPGLPARVPRLPSACGLSKRALPTTATAETRNAR